MRYHLNSFGGPNSTKYMHFQALFLETSSQILFGRHSCKQREVNSRREGVKPGTNARDPGPKSGTNFYGHQKVILRATIKIKIGLSVVYRVFSMMYIIVFPKISNCLNF